MCISLVCVVLQCTVQKTYNYLHLHLYVLLDQYVSLGHLLHNGYSLYQKTVTISEDAT